jgi:hypothetical protein
MICCLERGPRDPPRCGARRDRYRAPERKQPDDADYLVEQLQLP